MIVTRQLLREWCACYTDAQIAELVPESGLTPIQLIDLDIPDADRIWGACQILAREDRPELVALAQKWAATAARWAAAAAAPATAGWAAGAAAGWAAAAAAAAAGWAAARKQQVADCREALAKLESKS